MNTYVHDDAKAQLTPMNDLTTPTTAPGQVISYTVENGRRWLYGYPVWIGDEKPVVFKDVGSQIAYLHKMDAITPDGVEFRKGDKRVSVCIGLAVRGVDYGRGSVSRHFAGHTPRGAYQFR